MALTVAQHKKTHGIGNWHNTNNTCLLFCACLLLEGVYSLLHEWSKIC